MHPIEVSHIAKSFGSTQAVADVSFDVDRGEIFGLLLLKAHHLVGFVGREPRSYYKLLTSGSFDTKKGLLQQR